MMQIYVERERGRGREERENNWSQTADVHSKSSHLSMFGKQV